MCRVQGIQKTVRILGGLDHKQVGVSAGLDPAAGKRGSRFPESSNPEHSNPTDKPSRCAVCHRLLLGSGKSRGRGWRAPFHQVASCVFFVRYLHTERRDTVGWAEFAGGSAI